MGGLIVYNAKRRAKEGSLTDQFQTQVQVHVLVAVHQDPTVENPMPRGRIGPSVSCAPVRH